MQTITLFKGTEQIATGAPTHVSQVWQAAQGTTPLLAFDDDTGRVVDLPVTEEPRSRGRPKLGVTAREVTLLPRHWEWLSRQRGGASATLRRLVEAASRAAPDRARQSRDVAYRFMQAIAGDLPGYEEALRALYAGDAAGFEAHTADWPTDIRRYSRARAAEGLAEGLTG